MLSVVSTRKPVLVAVVVLALSLTSCSSPTQEARSLAIAALRDEYATLKSVTQDLASTSTSPANALSRAEQGDLGIVWPNPVDNGTDVSAPTFRTIFDMSADSTSIRFSAVLEAKGETGGGFTSGQASVYLCVHVSETIPSSSAPTVRGVKCRADISSLLKGRSENELVGFSTIEHQQ
jgi:hypothetical protein